MSTELIINASLPETRIALMEDGEIQELLIERASGKGIVGNIYKGRVTRVLPGMQAAFVDIGLEKAAFLYVDDVFVHSEIWAEEEGETSSELAQAEILAAESSESPTESSAGSAPYKITVPGSAAQPAEMSPEMSEGELSEEDLQSMDHEHDEDHGHHDHDGEDEENDDEGPVEMGPPDDEGKNGAGEQPTGTIAPESSMEAAPAGEPASEGSSEASEDGSKRRHRRGRRGGRGRKRSEGDRGAISPVVAGSTPAADDQPAHETTGSSEAAGSRGASANNESYPENYYDQMSDQSETTSDRSDMSHNAQGPELGAHEDAMSGRPENTGTASNRQDSSDQSGAQAGAQGRRPEFREQRGRDRRIRTKTTAKPVRGQVNIQDLLQEGQEVLVQVAKDPIATKGARLTCHISLPGRHLVCMPTIDHVGVSRRIERDDERRKLREYVERYRPRNLGFIVRTASGKSQSEKRIKQDIEYLARLWTEIREKAAEVTAPALVYEDLNSVLRAIRDWVTEDIDKIVVDSRYHYNDIQRFVSHFMPSLKQKVELYHGDTPIFDAYNISTELSRALERKVWLKSGGYLVVDQAEALVAIDVNTGRYVGKKNLEDTILKTNLEAVQEIAYQLRLRNCGGIIILDLIDMEKEENKYRVYRALEEALKKDRARPTILKISELGLVEMTRKRTRDTIIRSLCESCSHCEGKGFIKSKQTVAYEVMREVERDGIDRDVHKILIQAHSDVIDILAIDERESLDQMERRYRKTIYLQSVPDFHQEQFEVVSEKRNERGEVTTSERSSGIAQPERGERDGGGRGRGGRGRSGGKDWNKDRNRNTELRGSAGVVSVTPLPAPIVIKALDRAPEKSADRSERSPERERTVISIKPVVNPAASDLAPNYDESQPMQNESALGQTGQAASHAPAPGVDDFYDEEDRLAFLRAQATQDAAIASLAANPGAAPTTRPARGPWGGRGAGQGQGQGQGQGREGGRNNKRRRGGRGKFNNRPERGTQQTAGPVGPAGDEPRREVNVKPVQQSVPAGDTGGGGSGSGGHEGGGGDHSQPPV